MPPADFRRPFPTPRSAGSTRQIDRSPRKCAPPPSRLCPPHTRPCLPSRDRVFEISATSPGMTASLCDFCSSGRHLACGFLWIPPRSGPPLPSRLTVPPVGSVEDSHLQVSAPCRGAHKQKKPPPWRRPLLSCIGYSQTEAQLPALAFSSSVLSLSTSALYRSASSLA